MKTKTILGIIFFLAVVLIAGNKIAGNFIAKEIDSELQRKIDNREIPLNVAYEKVKVNPLFSKVNIITVSASEPGSDYLFTCDEFKFKVPYKEALRLARSTTFEELKSIELQLEKPLISDTAKTVVISMDDLTIDFDGHLTIEDIENMKNKFPDIPQELDFSFSNLQFDVTAQNKPAAFRMNAAMQKQFSQISKGHWKMVYDPANKKIQLEDMSLSSKIMSVKNNSIIKYSGEGWSDFKLQSSSFNADMVIKPKDVEWGEGEEKGHFSLSKYSLKMNSKFEANRKAWPIGHFELLIKDLEAHYPETSSRNIINIPMAGSIKELSIDEFTMDYQLANDKLTISETKLISNIMDATLDADVSMDKGNPNESIINNAKLVVQELSPELTEAVANLEKQFGKTLPRENNQIVLEIYGTLGKPKIKGLEF